MNNVTHLPDADVMKRIMDRLAEERQIAEQVRAHKWSVKSNREKAEALISKVDPSLVQKSDLPKIALAQVHATLAVLDFNRVIERKVED